MFRLGNRKRSQNVNEEIEEELVINEGVTDEFGLEVSQQPKQAEAPSPPKTINQGVADLKGYIDELSRRINEITSIKEEIDKLMQLKPTIENYITTLSEIIKALNEIENQLNKIEELRKRL